MEKLLGVILVMSLITVSCNKSDGGSSQESTTVAPVTNNTNTDEVKAPEATSTLPATVFSFKTNVSYLTGFDAIDEDKYDQAVALVKKTVATEAFRSAVLNHTYGGVKTFIQNNGLSNAEIYQSILDAAEKLTPSKNNTMDVGVKLYYENSKIVGFTNPSISYINVNTKFFDTYALNSVAANLFHEWLHKIGYGHDVAATTRRPYSVPYAVGNIIRTIAKSFL